MKWLLHPTKIIKCRQLSLVTRVKTLQSICVQAVTIDYVTLVRTSIQKVGVLLIIRSFC